MRPAVEFPDLESWLTGWLRPQLPDCFVSNRLTSHSQRFSVVVVDDSGRDDLVTAERRVSIRCRGESRVATGALARYVAVLMRGAASGDPANPVAAVDQIFGPHRTDEASDLTEFYLSVELILIGSPAPKEPTYA